MLVMMFTMLGRVLVFMTHSVGSVLVLMNMLMLMFMIVSLS